MLKYSHKFEDLCDETIEFRETHLHTQSQPQIASTHCESSCSLLGPRSIALFTSHPIPCFSRTLFLSLSIVLLFLRFLSSSRSSLLSLRWNAIDSMHIWQQGSSRLTLYIGWPWFISKIKRYTNVRKLKETKILWSLWSKEFKNHKCQ